MKRIGKISLALLMLMSTFSSFANTQFYAEENRTEETSTLVNDELTSSTENNTSEVVEEISVAEEEVVEEEILETTNVMKDDEVTESEIVAETKVETFATTDVTTVTELKQVIEEATEDITINLPAGKFMFNDALETYRLKINPKHTHTVTIVGAVNTDGTPATRFVMGSTQEYGRFIAHENGTLDISNVLFEGNAYINGGIEGYNITVNNTVFTENHGTQAAPNGGGAIAINRGGGDLKVRNSKFYNNFPNEFHILKLILFPKGPYGF